MRNPGRVYLGSRHNVGAEIVDHLAGGHDIRWRRGPVRIPAELAEGRLGRKRVVLAKPIRFMNESGEAVRALVDYFKSDRLLVVHDDIDLALGRLRLQVGGGSGGHNGVKAIIAVLGAGFPRLKVGVGRPPGSQDPADFVLERFSKSERSEVDLLVPDGAEVVERWLTDPARAQELAAHRGRS